MSKDKESRDGGDSLDATSPYGPQHGRVDDASGGADSSPFEAMSSDERAAALRKATARQSDAELGGEG